jgi:hypothetical protein
MEFSPFWCLHVCLYDVGWWLWESWGVALFELIQSKNEPNFCLMFLMFFGNGGLDEICWLCDLWNGCLAKKINKLLVEKLSIWILIEKTLHLWRQVWCCFLLWWLFGRNAHGEIFWFFFFDSSLFPLCTRVDKSYLCGIAKMNKICESSGSDEYVNGQQIFEKRTPYNLPIKFNNGFYLNIGILFPF